MDDNNKNMIDNEELNEDFLPTPDTVEQPEEVNPDFIPIPEEEDAYLPDITPEMVREEMIGVNDEGYSRCAINVELKKINNFNPEAEGNEGYDVEGPNDTYEELVLDDESEELFTTVSSILVDYCRVQEYCLDGRVVNLELIFDSPYDKGMQEVYRMLDEYKDMCEAFDKAEPGEGDLPIFNVNFMPEKYPMQGIAAYSQPFAYFRTLGAEGNDYRIIHLMFPIERTGITCYHVKKEDLAAMEEYVMSEINSGRYE